jgi:hypothetical protein
MKPIKSFFLTSLIILFLLTTVFSVSCTSGKSNTASPKPNSALQSGTETGDPDWWKKQPDLKKEEAAINETIKGTRDAFTAKDANKALTFIAPDDRDKFKEVFAKSPEILPKIAKDMENTSLSFLSLDSNYTPGRIAEYTMKVDGYSFYIEFIKIDGKWYIKNF